MTDIKDTLQNIKERFSNPLIFSFILSWLICNWKITVALVWYDPAQVSQTGCQSVFEFIDDYLTHNHCFWLPLIIALIYALFGQLLRTLLKALDIWVKTWGDDWHLQIMKDGSIPINKYLSLKKEVDARAKILDAAIKGENTFQTENATLKTDLYESQQRNTELNTEVAEQVEKLRKSRDVTELNGFWTCKFDNHRGLSGQEEIEIADGLYYIFDTSGNRRNDFKITNYYADPFTGNVFFIKERMSMSKPVSNGYPKYNINEVKADGLILNGVENGDTEIRYSRKLAHVPEHLRR